jgi:hypothetical protein
MLGPPAAALVLHAGLLAAYVAAFHCDVSALVCVNAHWAGRPPFEAVAVRGDGPGFDGQFYYVLARNPWRRLDAFLGEHDRRPYRHQRILFPVLAWTVSAGGNPRALLWVLPALNLLAIAGLAYLGACTARHFGMSEWWGLVLPFAVNAAMPMMRDLTDPFATFAVAGLLVGWLLEWRWWTLVLWAAAAVFAREQNAAVVGFVLAGALWRRQFRLAAGLGSVLALWGGWLGLLYLLYGQSPFLEGGITETPLSGLIRCWTHPTIFRSSSRILHVAYMLAFTVQIALCFYMAISKGDRVVASVGVLGAVFALLAGWAFTYNDPWSYTRVFVWIPLAVWLNSVRKQLRWPMLTAIPAALFPICFIHWQLHAR